MPQMMVFGQILEGQCFAIFGERQQRFEVSHVEIDIVADRAVVASWRRWTVDHILHHVILQNPSAAEVKYKPSSIEVGKGSCIELIQINCLWPSMHGKRWSQNKHTLGILLAANNHDGRPLATVPAETTYIVIPKVPHTAHRVSQLRIRNVSAIAVDISTIGQRVDGGTGGATRLSIVPGTIVVPFIVVK